MTDRPYTAADLERDIAERDKAEAKERAQKNEEIVKYRARQTWIAQNGDPDTFESAWSEKGGLREQFAEQIRQEQVKQTVEHDRTAREEFRTSRANKI
jgi:hypothetical protein